MSMNEKPARNRALLSGALTLATVLSASGCGKEDKATGPELPGRAMIAYSSMQNGNSDIWTMNGDGTNKRKITNAVTSNEYDPAWSPDGSRIAFVTDRDGDTEVYIMTADGGSQRNLTNSPQASEASPCWGPDGTRIAFQSDRSGNWDIFVMDADGRDVRNLTNSPWEVDGSPAWDPLGQGIAISSDVGGFRDIYLLDVGTGARTPLTYHEADNTAPAWKSNGSQILFSRLQQGLCPEIWVMDRDGANQRRVIDFACAHGGEPAWSPDGEWIAYTYQVEGGSEIYVADANGQNRVNLSNPPGSDGDADWRP